jgi:predicted GIY-YIG superfamily endonuclease
MAGTSGAGVYLLHFDRPYRHAAHYLGYAHNIGRRLDEHAAGTGGRLTQVVKAAGIGWQLARTWPGQGRTEERRLKNRGGSRRHCPLCRASRGKVAA